MKPYPPLGILYICSHLRRKGLQAEVFDSTFSSRQDLWNLLKQGPPSILGIYANLMTRPNVVEILRVAKELGWQTVVGGPEPSAYIQEYLAALRWKNCCRRFSRTRSTSCTTSTGSRSRRRTVLWCAPSHASKSKTSMRSRGRLAN